MKTKLEEYEALKKKTLESVLPSVKRSALGSFKK